MGMTMNQKQQPDSDSEYTFYFQMSDGVGRFSCAVAVAASTRSEAEELFRENSTTIVQMARDNISRGLHKDLPLRLSFP
jgi:hypothetical protein